MRLGFVFLFEEIFLAQLLLIKLTKRIANVNSGKADEATINQIRDFISKYL